MLFYEPIFLFVFLPATFFITLRLRHSAEARTGILLIASILFYFWGEPAFVPVVLASSGLDYLLAGPVARRTRWALVVGVGANLAVLVAYKYLGFLAENFYGLLGWAGTPTPPPLQIALPIGVSFIVFEKITYLVDVWRGLSPPSRGFGHYLTYIFFFPKLLAGPIIKYHEIEAQLRRPPRLDEPMVVDGFARFVLGVVKKVLVADTIAPAADAAFSTAPEQLGFATAWAGILLFTLQIYLDFSAYSDMAIGLARMFGFRLNENFNRPYISCSITEFWRRWHISLTSWIREYLYIPLGGNRVQPWRRMANLWICFLASGLWHGAAWTYVLWGAYNGLFLVLDRLFLLRWLDRMPRLLANVITLLVVMLGWTIFRSTSLEQLSAFLHAASHPSLSGIGLRWDNSLIAATAVGVVVSLAPKTPWSDALWAWFGNHQLNRLCGEAVLAVLFAIALNKAITDPFRPFLYFRF
ncbi:MBOAT family O-acyltransferase [Belnapia rosea]|uniref:MBOAT family O-acyltransferase n=1 Tax=Belnapia rosea TaxID=938405 RepID=UPI00088FBB3A|nr:MBOAT family O-acyltransferase [Belnapia rosea]SDB74847.1 alginate O-acetyltransferase complex protein AlgI [Belnapia rosea]